MDPLTAIDLVVKIYQFLDFSGKLIHGAKEVYVSSDGLTRTDKSLDTVVKEMKSFSSALLPLDGSRFGGDDGRSLCRLAAECNIISDQILELLEKVRSKHSNSRLQSVWTALKSKMQEKDRQELERRLESCRNQLGIQLNFFNSSKMMARIDTLVGSKDELTTGLSQLQNQIEQLQRGVSVESISSTAQDQLREILDISEKACEAAWQRSILKSLEFPDMHGRFEAVATTRYKCFEWIFEDTSLAHKDENHAKRQSFLDWLSTGTGIFHISGKLGSGKSTLMKYLFEHDRTKAEISKWAADRKLVFTNFFFWKPGSQLQKSLDGLFRSLLHDVLKSCPELIPEALPKYWNEAKLMPPLAQSKASIRNDEIRAAFSRIIERQKLYENHCFCFFIDGLDEYEATHTEDAAHMVDLLTDWTRVAPESIKICVSSREHNVFMTHLSSERRLCLQDLTREDMKEYIQRELENIKNEEEKADLVNGITEKASGIFLWVCLVVKWLRQRLEDGCPFADLKQGLNIFPRELDELFRHLLDSIDISDRKKAFQTFKIIEILENTKNEYEHDHLWAPRQCMSLFSWSFIDEYHRNREFALPTSRGFAIMDSYSREQRLDRARKRLNGVCQGLVELRIPPDADYIALAFTHRSVPEFLQTPEVEANLESNIGGEDSVDLTCQLIFAELRATDIMEVSDWRLSNLVWLVVLLRGYSRTDCAPYTFLEFLHSLVLAREQGYPDKSTPCVLSIQTTLYHGWIIQNSDFDYHASYYVWSPALISAFRYDYEYILWKIKNDPTTINTEFRQVLVFHVIQKGLLAGRPGALETLKMLFLLGFSSHTLAWNSEWYAGGIRKDTKLSVWHEFILKAFLDLCDQYVSYETLGQVFQVFLEYGADPYFWISASRSDKFSSQIVVTHGTQQYEFELVIKDASKRQFLYKHVSIRDLIEYWQFENSGTLLKLLDRNARRDEQGRVAESGNGREFQRQHGKETVIEETQIAAQDAETSSSKLTLQSAKQPELEERKVTEHTRGSGRDRYWSESIGRSHAIMFVLGMVSVLVALNMRTLVNK